MGCSSNKNVEVEESSNVKTDNKNKKSSKSDAKDNSEEEEEEKEKDEEEIELNSDDDDNDNENTIDKLKRKHMMHEYVFYPTTKIPTNRFPKKNLEGVLPSDFASKEKKDENKQYFCFSKNENNKNNKKNNFMPEEESEKSDLINNDIYLFNQKTKRIKSIRPLKRDEMIKSYNYQIEIDFDGNGIIEKRSNKDKDQYDYLDMFPNGEGYKFINREEEEPKAEKKKIIVPKKKTDEKEIENIKKNDVNDIANIINKELKENGLVADNQKKDVHNSNDF